MYTDNSLLAGPDENRLEDILEQMKDAQLGVTEEGTLSDFLGVNINRQPDGTIKLSQPKLTNQILKDLCLWDNDRTSTKSTPIA